jgi:hypothetical protein
VNAIQRSQTQGPRRGRAGSPGERLGWGAKPAGVASQFALQILILLRDNDHERRGTFSSPSVLADASQTQAFNAARGMLIPPDFLTGAVSMYRPKFCAECGEKIIRLRWRVWTSRMFCDDCAPRFIRDQLFESR